MRNIYRLVAAAVLGCASTWTSAAFHLWQVTELYSNADGTVQFVELTALAGSQQFLFSAGADIKASDGSTTHTYAFPNDLPGDTAGKKMLIGTTGFAALGIVTPDYVVPNGFFFQGGGSINFAGGFDTWNHPATPAPPLSLNRNGTTGTNSPTNFAGQTGTVPAGPPAIGLSPSPITFSPNSINTTSAPNIVTITNNHTSAVTISSVTVNGDFLVSGNNCTTLAPAATCSAGVYFRPTTDGARTGTLTVTSNAPGSPHTATATGTGERSLVVHYYRSILRRAPDGAGKTFWTNEAARVSGLGANVNETWYAMAQQFYFSPEYAAFNSSDSAFVTDLYNTFYNRPPDSGGLGFWVNNLGQGMPREVVLAEFMFSTEFRSFAQAIFGNTAARAEVDMAGDFYRGLLSRLPDSNGFTFWISRFRAAQCNANPSSAIVAEVESISSAFATSAEYTNRGRTNAQYVGDLYNAFLRRGGDLSGVQFWIGQLNSSAQTREQVRVQFKNSTEFQQRVQAVIAQGCSP